MRKGRGKDAKRSYCLKDLVDFRAAQAAGTADRTLAKNAKPRPGALFFNSLLAILTLS